MKIISEAAVLSVSNLEASMRFYVDILGFREQFRYGPYAGVERDGSMLHITTFIHPADGAPGAGSVYFFCDEVDTYCQALTARQAPVEAQPQDQPYGMRDFAVIDPDGNRLSFGCPVKVA